MLAPRVTDVITWDPYVSKKTLYAFQEFASHGCANANGSFSKSLTRRLVNVEVSTLSKQSFLTKIFSVKARTFKASPLTSDSFDSVFCITLLRVVPRVNVDSREASKPAAAAICL